MKNFNILDSEVNLKHSRFLEASAGTGKTFSIENLYTRLLMEHSDIKSENILVVTFTKAAAQDLKTRIKKCLEKARLSVNKVEKIQDLKAALLLEDAIYNFDQAAIYTIHGFCFKALQENSFEAGMTHQAKENTTIKEDLIEVVRSYLTTELDKDFISLGQLELVLKNFRGKVLKLQEALLQTILKGQDIIASSTYKQSFNSFSSFFQQHHFQAEKVLNDLTHLAPHYLEICDRTGNPKKENFEKLKSFAELFDKQTLTAEDFDQQLKDGLYAYHAFRDSKKKAKAKIPELNYPQLNSILENELWPVIQEAGDPLAIFASLAAGCQKKLHLYLEESNKLEFSFLLKKMHQAVYHTPFLKAKLREQYKVVIIDEFQDTDPLQWDIFYQLFFEGNSKTIVYLVGDPKQSIYSFRSADIYTYLAAEQAMSSDAKSSLQINYRSQPSLIRALNTLFNEENTPGWIDLPYHKKYLPYQPVLHSEKNSDKLFKDTLGSVHFCVAAADKSDSIEDLEKKSFFPFFIQEIKRLNVLEHVAFQEMAILVHDRFQAKRLLKALSQANVPGVLQRTGSLVQSAMLPAVHELLTGILYPKQESLFKAAMGGRLIGLDLSQILLFDDSSKWAKAVEQALFLRDIWQKKGIGQFFQELLESRWETVSLREKLLSYEDGASNIDELMGLVGLLIEFEFTTYASPEKEIEYLEELLLIKDAENEELKIQQDVTRDAVNILTIHASKGLEYGIVFALGLCNRSPAKENLIQNRSSTMSSLQFFPAESEEVLLHTKECDAEKMRQLYVAMTRGKHRLYMPCIKGWKPPKLGCASPVELFLARHHQPLCSYEELYDRLQYEVICNIRPDNEITLGEHHEYLDTELHIEYPQALVKPENAEIPGKSLFCSSFSSIAVHGEIFQPIEAAPKDFESSIKTIHTLPAGRETGLLFHEILEKMPFNIAEHELQAFVQPFIKNSLYQDWSEVFVAVLANVLHCPFLRNLNANSCFREMEFLFSSELLNNQPPGFMTGVVDLVFRANDKYYLLDWKTNWLGSNVEAYSFESMHQAMAANQYHLQAHLYSKALKQYVKQFDIRPFEASFGGAFYIFLRGLQLGSELGIYHFFPEVGDE